MTAGERRYAEMIAIRLAVEIVTRQRHGVGHGSYLYAARHLGARRGSSKRQALPCLVALLTVHTAGRYRPTATVTRALTSRATDTDYPTATPCTNTHARPHRAAAKRAVPDRPGSAAASHIGGRP